MASKTWYVEVISAYVTGRRGTDPNVDDFVASSKVTKGGKIVMQDSKMDNGILWWQSKSNSLWYGVGRYGNIYLKALTPTDIPLADRLVYTAYIAKQSLENANNTASASNTISTGRYTEIENNSGDSLYGLPEDDVLEEDIDYTSLFYTANSEGFPKCSTVILADGKTKSRQYDYTIEFSSSFLNTVNEIRKNLNLTTAYDRNTINAKYHFSFNRFHIEHPDIVLRNTVGYVVFTRPDLNFFKETSTDSYDINTLSTEMGTDPRVRFIASNNPALVRSLTKDGVKGHNFNPFLTNMVMSLEVMDDSVETYETGETFTGYKSIYAKNNIKSITAGNLSIKFRESFDLGITHMFQLWVDYISNVYKGLFTPKRRYIWEKVIDYACDVYYFLLDADGETILFWSKYYGVYPLNVGKSAFSYDYGANIQMPEISETFAYIYKEDLSPVTLVEFNRDAGISGNSTNIEYVPVYMHDEEKGIAQCTPTWAGVPFISTYTRSNGIVSNSQGFKLRFSPEKDTSSNNDGPLTI